MVCCIKGIWLHPYALALAKLPPRFGKSCSLEEWKSCHNVIVETDIHRRPIHTSILDIWKVCELLVCCFKGVWVCALMPLHRPSCPQIWGFKFTWGVEMIPQCHGWHWNSPQTSSYIHIRHIQSVWAIGMLFQGHMVAPLYCYTGQVGPRFGMSGSLEELKWCHHQKLTARWYWWVMKLWNCYDTLVLWSKGFFTIKYRLKQSHKFTLNNNI